MAARRLIVHAGLPKTGTTSIQISLERSAPELAASGLSYLHFLRWPAFGPADMETAFTCLHGLAEKLPGDVVTSNEALTAGGRYGEVAAAFARAFGDWRVEVVVFLTEPVRLAERSWRQNAIHMEGFTTPPEVWVERRLARGCFDYAGLVAGWHAAGAATRVLDYDGCTDVLADFAGAIGADLCPVERQNRSFSAAACRASVALKQAGVGPRARMRALDLVEATAAEPDAPMIDGSLAARIRAAYRPAPCG